MLNASLTSFELKYAKLSSISAASCDIRSVAYVLELDKSNDADSKGCLNESKISLP